MTTVLIVDDDASIRFAMADFLGAHGIAAACAASREEAQAMLEAAHYEVVITDLRLTPFDDAEGLRIVRLLGERYEDTACIVLTAFGSAETEAYARRHGAKAFLHKPLPMKQLLQIMTTLLPVRPGDGQVISSDAAESDGAPGRRPSDEEVIAPDRGCPTQDGAAARAAAHRMVLPGEHLEAIVDLIWEDVGRRVPRTHVVAVASAVTRELQDARIMAYVPLFVRRVATRRLLDEQAASDAGTSPMPGCRR